MGIKMLKLTGPFKNKTPINSLSDSRSSYTFPTPLVGTFTLSGFITEDATGTTEGAWLYLLYKRDGTYIQLTFSSSKKGETVYVTGTSTSENPFTRIATRGSVYLTSGDLKNIQIEEGSAVTPFEPYQEYLYKPGVSIISPKNIKNNLNKGGDTFSGWSLSSGMSVADGVLTFNPTAGAQLAAYSSLPNFVIGHKYFVYVEVLSPDNNMYAYALGMNGWTWTRAQASNDFVEYSGIHTCESITQDKTVRVLQSIAGYTSGYKARNIVVADLTAVFGAGNEPSTPAQAKEELFKHLYFLQGGNT